jgi:hypothetical protein
VDVGGGDRRMACPDRDLMKIGDDIADRVKSFDGRLQVIVHHEVPRLGMPSSEPCCELGADRAAENGIKEVEAQFRAIQQPCDNLSGCMFQAATPAEGVRTPASARLR